MTDNLIATAGRGVRNGVRHPLAAAGFVAGVALGAVRGAIGVARHLTGHAQKADDLQPLRDQAEQAERAERAASPGRVTEPAPEREPTAPGESFAHEPKASSQSASHLGRGADAADDWQAEAEDELADEDIPDPVGQLRDGVDDGDEPVLDPSIAKAVRSESETLSRGAEQDPGDATT